MIGPNLPFRERQGGYATATVILVMLVSIVGGALLLKRVRSQAAASGGYYQAHAAALAAEAGLQAALSQLETDSAFSIGLLNAHLADTNQRWLLGPAGHADSRHEIAMDNGLQSYSARIVAFDPKTGMVKLESEGKGPAGSESRVYGVYRLGGIAQETPVLAKYVWFMAGETRNVDQPMNVWGDVYIGGGVHFNGGADGSVFHGDVKIARGSGLQSTFDAQVDFCDNTYIQTPFKSQGGGIKFGYDGTGIEDEIFIDTDPLIRGNPNLFNGNVNGGHANLILQGHNVVHSGSLDLSRVSGAGNITDNGGPVDIAAALGMLPGPENEIRVNMASVPAAKRFTVAALGIGAWGNVTGPDLSAAYAAAKASGKLYKDFLMIEVNSPLNFVPAGGPNILRGKFAFEVSSQVNVNINLPESDPTSVCLWHVCTPGKIFGFGGSGLFRGYVNVSGTGSVVYQWGGGTEFQGAIHHVDATTGFQLNGSSGPLRLVFSSGVFDELAPLGILVPPGGIPVMVAEQVKLVDRNIRIARRSRYF